MADDQLDLFKKNRKVTKRLGRKPTGKRRDPRHRPRPEVDRHHPQHVTLRVVDGVGWLRRMDMYKAVHKAIHAALKRADFRCVHASIQGSHIHKVCIYSFSPRSCFVYFYYYYYYFLHSPSIDSLFLLSPDVVPTIL